MQMTGKVTYNGRNLTDFIPQRTYSYVSQYDLHHTEMTVRETLDFARLMLGGAESAGEHQNINMHVLGHFLIYLHVKKYDF